jgi:hypothetical protein
MLVPPISKTWWKIVYKSSDDSRANNYMIIMIGHTFFKLYVMVLGMLLFKQLERGKFRAKGQLGFKIDYQTTDLLFYLSLKKLGINLLKSFIAL